MDEDTNRTIRVLIADDQDMVRAGLAMILGTIPGVEVIGQARDGVEAVTLAQRLRPDVCLFDIRMPGRDGIEATRLLAGPQVADPLPIVVVTTFDLDEYVYGALQAGARGFLLKDAGPEMLGQAIRAAATGDALIAPGVTARLLRQFASSQAPLGANARTTQLLATLSERELEVLQALARGRTNAEIGSDLFISLSTVKSHIANLMTKLDARNRVELAMVAYHSGMVGAE